MENQTLTPEQKSALKIERLKELNGSLTSMGMPALNMAAFDRIPAKTNGRNIRALVERAVGNEANARMSLSNLVALVSALPPPENRVAQLPQRPQPSQGFSAAVSDGAVTQPITVPFDDVPEPAPRQAAREPMRTEQQPATPIAEVPRDSKADADRAKFHIYGGKGALTIEASERKNEKGVSRHVLYIDAAMAISAKVYDWKDKILFMLIPAEMMGVLSVLMGLLPMVEYKNHGEASDKALMVENQGKNLFIKVFHGRRMIAVPVTPEDTFRLAAILTRQISRNSYDIGEQEVLALVRSVYAPMKAKAPAPVARQQAAAQA